MSIEKELQKRYIQERKQLSSEAEKVVKRFFSNYDNIMVYHSYTYSSFRPFCHNTNICVELYNLSVSIYYIYEDVQSRYWIDDAITEFYKSNSGARIKILEKCSQKIFALLLKGESNKIQKIIKNNCYPYKKILPFLSGKKSVNDFLRYDDYIRKDLKDFILKYGFYYSKIEKLINSDNASVEKKNHLANKKAKLQEQNIKEDDKEENVVLRNNKESEKKDIIKKTKDEVEFYDLPLKSNCLYQSEQQLYSGASLLFDTFQMTAVINYGGYGFKIIPLSTKFIAPDYGVEFYNCEKKFRNYDPNDDYKTPILSNKIIRHSHFYKWFGVDYLSPVESLEIYGIIARCKDLFFFEYECYAPIYLDDERCILMKFETTEDEIENLLSKRSDLVDFLSKEDISLRDFKILDITSKLYHICNFYDIDLFLGIEGEYYEKDDILFSLTEYLKKNKKSKLLWNNYTIQEKEDYLSSRLKAIRNKEAFLRFVFVKLSYLKRSREVEIKYLIQSDYSVEVYVDIQIFYMDGTSSIYKHINVDSYDDKFVYFQGAYKIKSSQDYLNISEILLTCSDF